MEKKKAAAPRRKRPSKPVVRGERVKTLREKHDWPMWDLAYRAAVNPADIWQIENNRRDIRSAMLVRLVVALETSSDYLLGLTDDPKPRK